MYRDSSRNISGSDVTGSGPDRKWRQMKSRDRKWRHNRKYVLHMPGRAFPRFFLTIAVVRNVQLCMTGSSMANGCDMNGSHVTGSDVIFPAFFSYYSISIKWPEVVWLPDLTWRHRKWRHKTESGWFPLGCFLIFSRCCVVLQGCFLSCLRSHCGISTK